MRSVSFAAVLLLAIAPASFAQLQRYADSQITLKGHVANTGYDPFGYVPRFCPPCVKDAPVTVTLQTGAFSDTSPGVPILNIRTEIGGATWESDPLPPSQGAFGYVMQNSIDFNAASHVISGSASAPVLASFQIPRQGDWHIPSPSPIGGIVKQWGPIPDHHLEGFNINVAVDYVAFAHVPNTMLPCPEPPAKPLSQVVAADLLPYLRLLAQLHSIRQSTQEALKQGIIVLSTTEDALADATALRGMEAALAYLNLPTRCDNWSQLYLAALKNEDAAAESEKGRKGRTQHGQQRADEARTGDPNRQVGDANRVVREGRQFVDSETGNTVFVKGDRVVIKNAQGDIVTQFTNTRANTQQRIMSGKWVPK